MIKNIQIQIISQIVLFRLLINKHYNLIYNKEFNEKIQNNKLYIISSLNNLKNEFDIKSGTYLGKGAFGLVK